MQVNSGPVLRGHYLLGGDGRPVPLAIKRKTDKCLRLRLPGLAFWLPKHPLVASCRTDFAGQLQHCHSLVKRCGR